MFTVLYKLVLALAITILFGLEPVSAQMPAQPNASASRPDEPAPRGRASFEDRFIVVFHDDVDDARGLAKVLEGRYGFQVRHNYKRALKGFSGAMQPAIARALATHPDVAYVEQDLLAYADAQTTPSGIFRIGADQSPVADIDSIDDVRVDADVVVIDTGIDLDHPQLNVHVGKNFLSAAGCSAPAPGDDDNGHGTHIAGTIGAIDDDQNVVGVAPGVRLWSYKALCSNGVGYFSDIIDAVDNVVATDEDSDPGPDAEIINMSLSGIGYLQSLRDAIRNAVSQGIVIYVSASNEARDIYGNDDKVDTAPKSENFWCWRYGVNCVGDTIPAAYPEVGAVSAIDDADDTLASFSNYSANVDYSTDDIAGWVHVVSQGAAIDIAGPGVNILATDTGGGTSTKSGTSMASPHAAGTAALYIAENGRATDALGVYAIRQAIIDHSEGLAQPVLSDADQNNEAILNANFGPPLPPNNLPVADDDPSYITNEDDDLTLAAPGVLGNDNDGGDGPGPLNAILATGPTHGDLTTFDANGGFEYAPEENYHGEDTFTYYANDGQDSSAVPATVTITVKAVNDAPEAVDDTYTLDVSGGIQPLMVGAPGVLDNDSDVDGDALTAAVLDTGPTKGTLEFPGNGSFTYTPNPGFAGNDTFTYHAQDGNLTDSEIATVTVTVVAGPPSVHVHALEGSTSTSFFGWIWHATVTIEIRDANGQPVEDATVDGSWSQGASGNASCITNAAGRCSVTKSNIRRNVASVVFTVDNVTGAGSYDPGNNTVTSFIVERP